ncbi:hypothetical protein AB1N83_013334 [Pleurotus pulmonarius]
MFSKTAARSKGYFSGLPAAAIAMGHSTVVQPFRRMRTKVRKTTAKFRRHAPPAPAVDKSTHNAAVLSPVLPPLSPLDTETWWRRSPSPPRPASSASSTQNRSQSPFQPHDTEDIDAGSTSQVRRNSLWDQRFLPGLRIPNGFAMNNDASGQLLSPMTPLHSPVSPSPLYPSDMISPTSFYSQDSIPNNDHPYSSTIDTTISLTTPITDIFTNTYMNTNASNESETDEDFTPYGYEFTNALRFNGGESAAEEYSIEGIEGETNDCSITRPFEFTINNTQRFSGNEVIEYTIEGQYGTRLKELPAPRIHGMQDIDVLEIGPPANAPTIVELPAEASVHHILSGQEFFAAINYPMRAHSFFDDKAIDEIQGILASASLPLAKISIDVNAGCQSLPYAGELINDIFSVLQGCKIAPDEISVQLSLEELKQSEPQSLLSVSRSSGRGRPRGNHYMESPSHALRQAYKNVPPLAPSWIYGRMSFAQLSQLSVSFPVSIDDLVTILSNSTSLVEAVIGHVTPASSDYWIHSCKGATLMKMLSLDITTTTDLEPFFAMLDFPSLRALALDLHCTNNAAAFSVQWDDLETVGISGVSLDSQDALLVLCEKAARLHQLHIKS